MAYRRRKRWCERATGVLPLHGPVREFAQQRLLIGAPRRRLAHMRVEVAIGALVQTEGDMHIEMQWRGVSIQHKQ